MEMEPRSRWLGETRMDVKGIQSRMPTEPIESKVPVKLPLPSVAKKLSNRIITKIPFVMLKSSCLKAIAPLIEMCIRDSHCHHGYGRVGRGR